MSHCTENHNMDLNAWYKPPNVGFQWGNIILSIGTTLKQIWDHFMIRLHHHTITSKNCKCRTVGQRSSTDYRTVRHSTSIIFRDCRKHSYGKKNSLAKLFWTNFISFYLWKVPNSNISVRPYSVTCHFFLACLFLDRKTWEVAQHVFCYCFDIN